MQIDVYHDTVCPWCRIGKKHLDDAVSAWDGPAPVVRFRPFFLDETVPEAGLPFREYFIERKGVADPDPIFARVTEVGARLGLTFRFDRVRYATNTLRSHRLLELVPAERQGAVLDHVHRAYFDEGQDIGDPETLADCAAGVGLDREVILARLRGDEARAEVLAAAEEARQLGITGVPFFVFGGELAVSGAQPAPLLLQAMRRVAEPSLAGV